MRRFELFLDSEIYERLAKYFPLCNSHTVEVAMGVWSKVYKNMDSFMNIKLLG